jgi:hypothetical protein
MYVATIETSSLADGLRIMTTTGSDRMDGFVVADRGRMNRGEAVCCLLWLPDHRKKTLSEMIRNNYLKFRNYLKIQTRFTYFSH